MLKRIKIRVIEIKYKRIFKKNRRPTGSAAEKITILWEKYKNVIGVE